MADIMQRIRLILGLEDAEISRSKRAKTDARGLKASNEKGLRGAIDATGPERAPPSSGSRDRPSSSPEWTGFSDDQSVADKHDDEEEDFPAYNARIAPSDSESEVATPTESYTEEFRNMLAIPSADTSLSRSTSPSSTSPPSKTHKSNVVSSRSNSTFIPSLMGGYWSGSESAEEDDLTERKARKNRRGQQARRQLWEKKYGRKANHLSSKNRDQDWDSRNGARSSDDRGKRGRGRGRGYERGPVPNQRSNDGGHGSGANSNPVVARVRAKKEDGPLHPSWEAAKKAKEQKKNVAFQGKKVVFD